MTMSMTTLPSSEIHLLSCNLGVRVPGASAGGEPEAAPLPAAPLVVPSSPVRLEWNGAGLPRLVPRDAGPTGAGQLDGPWLEELAGTGSSPRLLLVAPAAERPRVNGEAGYRISVLRNADEFHFDGSCTFRVAIFHRPQLGPIPPDLAGQPCAVCTTRVRAEDRCLVCPCGAVFHMPAEEGADGSLACVLLARECPRCQQPIRLAPGYEGEGNGFDEGPGGDAAAAELTQIAAPAAPTTGGGSDA